MVDFCSFVNKEISELGISAMDIVSVDEAPMSFDTLPARLWLLLFLEQ